jgi:heptosyltransferase III
MMHIKKVAIICSDTISDGLMMMVATHRLCSEGAHVITFHDKLHELADWFQDHLFSPRIPLEIIEVELTKFDLVILQYDSTTYAKEIVKKLSGLCKPLLSIFYPTYSKYTHPPLKPCDLVFNKQIPMVDNVALAISSLLQARDHSKNNGLAAPSHLLHRRYKKRVAILRSSHIPKKYDKIGEEVRKLGYDPIFLTSDNIPLGASIIYESGYFIGPESDLCHLASNLHIPTLVVSGNKKPISLQKPGWLRSSFITFPRWLPQIFLERFVLVSKVVTGFKQLAKK